MYSVKELFADLSREELSNLAIGGEGSGSINEKSWGKLIGCTNEGLIRLHSRFVLKESEVLLTMFGHITNYHLSSKYALSKQEPEAEGCFYINDLMGEPFEDDLIKVLTVNDSHGQPLPLNDPENPWSLFTPKFNVLQVTHPKEGMALSVVYQARHAKLGIEDVDGVSPTDIDIPDVLYGALKGYISYKVFSHMNTQEATAKAQEHLSNFETICNEALDRDLVNTSLSFTSSCFEKRGFV